MKDLMLFPRVIPNRKWTLWRELLIWEYTSTRRRSSPSSSCPFKTNWWSYPSKTSRHLTSALMGNRCTTSSCWQASPWYLTTDTSLDRYTNCFKKEYIVSCNSSAISTRVRSIQASKREPGSIYHVWSSSIGYSLTNLRKYCKTSTKCMLYLISATCWFVLMELTTMMPIKCFNCICPRKTVCLTCCIITLIDHSRLLRNFWLPRRLLNQFIKFQPCSNNYLQVVIRIHLEYSLHIHTLPARTSSSASATCMYGLATSASTLSRSSAKCSMATNPCHNGVHLRYGRASMQQRIMKTTILLLRLWTSLKLTYIALAVSSGSLKLAKFHLTQRMNRKSSSFLLKVRFDQRYLTPPTRAWLF